MSEIAAGQTADQQQTMTSEPAAQEEDERVLPLPAVCLLALAVGIVSAGGAVMFRALIAIVHNVSFYGLFSFAYNANEFMPASPLGPLIIVIPIIGGLIVVWLVRTFAPEAKGHGVPEVMFAVYHNAGNVRGIVSVIKMVASGISIGTGASVGREGPIIQIGSSFGSTVGRWLNLARWQKITLLSAGAGAGIAATFNTPLGGVLFASEMLLPEVSSRTLLPVVVATSTATYIGHVAFGLHPAFIVPGATIEMQATVDLVELGTYALLGVVAGVASWLFVRTLAWLEDTVRELPGSDYLKNIGGMFLIGVTGYLFLLYTGHYQTYGVGYATIQSVLTNGITGVGLLLILFIGKMLATCLSLSTGASGGVFSPSLFLGATLGAAVGNAGQALLPGHQIVPFEFAMVGMGAMVGGSTGATMTAIVMIFEMTRDYNVIVPLVLAAAISVSIRRFLIVDNIYTVKFRGRGRPIPVNRHTNMYLVQQARQLMSTDFICLPSDTSVPEALKAVAENPDAQIIVTDGPRIAGIVKLGAAPYKPDRFSAETLRALTETDFVVAPENGILNTIIGRMSKRNRSFAVVVRQTAGKVPRPEDIVGIITEQQIAQAVVRNHYA